MVICMVLFAMNFYGVIYGVFSQCFTMAFHYYYLRSICILLLWWNYQIMVLCNSSILLCYCIGILWRTVLWYNFATGFMVYILRWYFTTIILRFILRVLFYDVFSPMISLSKFELKMFDKIFFVYSAIKFF